MNQCSLFQFSVCVNVHAVSVVLSHEYTVFDKCCLVGIIALLLIKELLIQYSL